MDGTKEEGENMEGNTGGNSAAPDMEGNIGTKEEGENNADMEGNTGGNMTAPDMEENTTEGQRSMRNKIKRRTTKDGGSKKRRLPKWQRYATPKSK